MNMKGVEVEYIESGAFQGGEEDAFTAEIKPGDTCFVISEKDRLRYDDALTLLQQIYNDGDNLISDEHQLKFIEIFNR